MLTFLAPDAAALNLVYANADLSRVTWSREAIAFCDHWRNVSGADPHLLVMAQAAATHKGSRRTQRARRQVSLPSAVNLNVDRDTDRKNPSAYSYVDE